MKNLLSISIISIACALFTGCEEENPVIPPVYQSKLIGEWTQVVDTVTPEGRAFWIDPIFGGLIRKPQIDHYVNDTVCYSGNSGIVNYLDTVHYFTRSDSIFVHTRGGMITKADTISHKFRIKNDTLFFSDTTSRVEFFIRVK